MLDSRTREILHEVRRKAEAGGVRASFSLHRENSHLMRIGNSSVSLSTSEKLSRLDIRVIDGKRREGSHTHLGEIDSADQVASLLEIAAVKAKAAVEKSFEPLLEEVEETTHEEPQFDPELESMEPALKSDLYAGVFEQVGQDYSYSGAWSSGSVELFLISTANDRELYHRGTDQQFSVVLKHPTAEWELRAEATGWKAGDVRASAIVDELSGLTGLYETTGGKRIEPGDYTVLFGPAAVAELVHLTAFSGFHGRLYEENRSWTAGKKPGERVVGENIDLTDDPANHLTFMHGFDLGGKSRKRFAILENGAIGGFMYDLATAAKHGREPTGHELRSPSFVMGCGDGPSEPTEAARERGGRILTIPALHYVNMPNLSTGQLTGSSRFNATFVESGKVMAPLLSSRITDTLPRIMSNVSRISPVAVSVNLSSTYARRAPVAVCVPSYLIVEDVRITDCADSF